MSELNLEIKDKVESLNHNLHQTFSMLILAATGLKHLKNQIVEPYNPIEFHKLNAQLELELKENFSNDYIKNINSNPETLNTFLAYLTRIEAMRDELVEFVKVANSGK